jgi:hypothetical protein
MQKASGYRFQVSGLAALVSVLTFACFGFAGEQAGNAPGKAWVRQNQEHIDL